MFPDLYTVAAICCNCHAVLAGHGNHGRAVVAHDARLRAWGGGEGGGNQARGMYRGCALELELHEVTTTEPLLHAAASDPAPCPMAAPPQSRVLKGDRKSGSRPLSGWSAASPSFAPARHACSHNNEAADLRARARRERKEGGKGEEGGDRTILPRHLSKVLARRFVTSLIYLRPTTICIVVHCLLLYYCK